MDPGTPDPHNFATVWSLLLKLRVRSGQAKAVCFRSVSLFLKTLRRPKQSCPVEGFVTTSLSTQPQDGTIPGDSSNFTDTQPAAHPKSEPEYIISVCRSARDSHGSRKDRGVRASRSVPGYVYTGCFRYRFPPEAKRVCWMEHLELELEAHSWWFCSTHEYYKTTKYELLTRTLSASSSMYLG